MIQANLAIVAHGAHDVRLEERAVPVPDAGEARIRIVYGGICGSDLHYAAHGAVGASTLRAPMILGHEVSGTIDSLGHATHGPPVGTPVTIHPSTACGSCDECVRGDSHLCPESRYLGSAAHFPHTEGAFSTYAVVRLGQLRVLPNGLALNLAALSEPLGVAVHAINRAEPLSGRKVLVNGAGPIGLLVAAIAVARGAAEVIAVDLADDALLLARNVGVNRTINVSQKDCVLPNDCDVVFEATGSPAALHQAIASARRGGCFVQVGLQPAGDVPFPLNHITTREIDVRGTYRFSNEISDAVEMLDAGLPVHSLLTQEFTVKSQNDVDAAFNIAGDRSRASKVLLKF